VYIESWRRRLTPGCGAILAVIESGCGVSDFSQNLSDWIENLNPMTA